MFFEKSSGRRNLRVGAGEGMLTVVRPTTVTYRDGSKETLIPDRHRFDPSHPLVAQRPEVFTLCVPKGDRTDAPARFRDALRAAERELTDSTRARSRPDPGLRSGREPWRLTRRRKYGRHQI